MNKNIVDKEIRHTVEHNAQTDEKKIIKIPEGTKIHEGNRGQSKNDEEIIIFLQNALVAVVMVIPVQYPEKAVHHVLVYNPGGAFHGNKNT